MRKSKVLIALCLLTGALSCSKPSATSPDGNLVFTLSVDGDGCPSYALKVNGEPVLEHSSLGFVLADSIDMSKSLSISSVSHSSHNETWEQVWGEQRFVTNNYNEVAVRLKQKSGNGLEYILRARVFNDGIGFRYEFPEQKALRDFVIMDELTSFNFTQEHSAWWMSRSEPYYEGYGIKSGFNQIDTAYTPLTLEGSDGRFYAIHEAALLDYAKMNLIPQNSNELKAWLTPWSDGTKVKASAPFETPWRTLIVSETAGGLTESRLMLNLNDPCKLEDTSWIQPGKYIGIWWELHKYDYTWYYGPQHGATTERTMEYIDFAAENGFKGVLVEGWNKGWDGNWMKNSEGFSFTEAYPDYDFDKIMKYAVSKGVQVIIHNETAANTVNYFNQIDSAYSMYRDAGMHYIKTGNVNLLMDGIEAHDGQYGVNRLHSVVEKAAEYQICVDEHEPVIPTGVGRTWPNLMTHEAVRGQEHNAWEPEGGNKPEHTTVMPFIRGLAGPMDFTFGTFDFRNPNSPFCRVNSTLTKQLAQYVVIYSPLQMASDEPKNYKGVKAFDFIKDVPVDWVESHVIDAVIGDYVVTVRKDRNSEDWYLGAITDECARQLDEKLDFLDNGIEYLAQIYSDAEDTDWVSKPTAFKYSERIVESTDSLRIVLSAASGCAVRFIPQNTSAR